MEIDEESIHHKVVSTYSFFDFLGTIAGVADLFIFIFGLVVFPIEKFNFKWRAIHALYTARTSDETLLMDTNDFRRQLNNIEKLPLDKKRRVRLEKKDKNYICLRSLMPFKDTSVTTSRASRLMRLYKLGIERLAEDFDVIKLFSKRKTKRWKRKAVLNLEDDQWQESEDQCEGVTIIQQIAQESRKP